MFFSLRAKRKMLSVLRAASEGTLSVQEIAERSGVSERSVSTPLDLLEQRGLIVSGNLLPADLKIYRVTTLGRESLAAGTIP